MENFKINGRVVFGLLVMLVGVVLLLNGLNVIDADISVSTFWPVILIVIGVIKIINFDESTFWGAIILLVGVYFQLRNLEVEFVQNIEFSNIFLPVIIVLIGVSMILPTKGKSSKVHQVDNDENRK